MLPLFSTSGLPARNRFKARREVLFERLVPVGIEQPDDPSFEGRRDVTAIAVLNASRVAQDALHSETPPDTMR
ncbi:MAG: hypothetical protein INR70_38745 [Parafilimonas terrae]|nr:hypothetical protein [Parafilimonas terrae]